MPVRPLPTLRSYVRGFRRGFRDPIFRILLGLVAGLVVLGTIAFHLVEGWNLLDSLYFSVVTMATVGYGDFTPHTPLGKVLAMGFIVFGIGVLVAFAQRLVAQMLADAEERSAAPPTMEPQVIGVRRRVRRRRARRAAGTAR